METKGTVTLPLEEYLKLRDFYLQNKAHDLKEFEWSVRTANSLQSANISTLNQLLEHTEGELLRTQCFGRKALNEVKEQLESIGLYLGNKGVNNV